MAALAPKGQNLAVFAGDRGEIRAEVDEFPDAIRPLAHQYVHGVFVAQARARLQRILQMETRRVIRGQHPGDAALGIVGVGLRLLFLREDDHSAVVSRLQRGPQSGDSRSDNKCIAVHIRG